MTRAGTLLLVGIGAVASGCMGGGMAGRAPARAEATAAAPPQATPPAMAHCPMAVPGTQVTAEDAPGGAAVTFRTSPDAVADLRARVQAMAEMHNRHHQGEQAEMHGGMHPGGGTPGMGHGGTAAGSAGSAGAPSPMEMPPPSHAFVEDLLDGARMTVTPNDPADLERLRSTVRAHARHMAETGTCEMDHGSHEAGAPPRG